MRIRLEFDDRIPVACVARKVLIRVPPNLHLISDLSHFLHQRFDLPQTAVVLSIAGFTLLSSQLVAEVLRDDDEMLVRCADKLPTKRRQAVMALTDGAHQPLKAVKSSRHKASSESSVASSACSEHSDQVAKSIPEAGNIRSDGEALVTEAAPMSQRLQNLHVEGIDWQPVTGDPEPGDTVRYRLEGADFEVGVLVAVEHLYDGNACLFLKSDGSEQWVLSSNMLQVSVSEGGVPSGRAETPLVSNVRDVQSSALEAPCAVPDVQACDLEAPSVGKDVLVPDVEPLPAPEPVKMPVKMPVRRSESLMAAPADPVAFAKHKLESLAVAVRGQVEFYFGNANYWNDNFLQSQKDWKGWTSLELVCKFNRIRELGIRAKVPADLDFVKKTLRSSEVVEVSEDGYLVRRR